MRIYYERDCPSTTTDWPITTIDWATTTTQTGPSPVPSPIGRGVITEIPLPSC